MSVPVRKGLRRLNEGRTYMPHLDGLRFMAIFMVFFYHLNGYLAFHSSAWPLHWTDYGRLGRLAYTGWLGVELLFVLSGFLIALPFLAADTAGRKQIGWGRFMARRLSRLHPPYVLALSLFFLAEVVLKGSSLRSLLPGYLAGLFYLHGIVFGRASGIMVASWALEVQMQFYLLAPLLAMALLRCGRLKRLAMILLALLPLLLAAVQPEWTAAPTLLRYLSFFMAGFLAADIYLNSWKASPSPTFFADIGAVVVLLILARTYDGPQPGIPWLIQTALLFLVLLGCVLRGKLSVRLLQLRPLATLGAISYSIFLLHFHLIALVGRFSIKIPTLGMYEADLLLQTLIVLPAVILVSLVFFLLVERPCMDPAWTSRLLAWRPRSSTGRSNSREEVLHRE